MCVRADRWTDARADLSITCWATIATGEKGRNEGSITQHVVGQTWQQHVGTSLITSVCGIPQGEYYSTRSRPDMAATRRHITNHLCRWHSSGISLRLETPTTLFSNHHLLIVDKPAGWRSIPSHDGSSSGSSSISGSKKCLLTYLKRKGLGGGSNNDFLLPVHRLDQPCTGILVLAKNSKAASRIQKAWAKGQVLKEYLCVVESPVNVQQNHTIALPELEELLSRFDENDAKRICNLKSSSDSWGKLSWQDEKENVFVISGRIRKSSGGGRGSVIVTPVDMRSELFNRAMGATVTSKGDTRICHLECRSLGQVSTTSSGTDVGQSKAHLIAVRTSTGARHQVRALLSAVGASPIAGDLRYGANRPLPDQSVALHARSLFMPSVNLGGTDLSSAPFESPMPDSWKDFFGLTEGDL